VVAPARRLAAEHADEKSDSDVLSADEEADPDDSESEPLLLLLAAGAGAASSSSRRLQLKLPLSRRERLLIDSIGCRRDCDRPKTPCTSAASCRTAGSSGTGAQRWRG
jgi:hypothetical protein